MATDWTPRTRALAYYEKLRKHAMRGDDDFEHLEQAINALRRSQDHTAIQKRLRAAHKVISQIAENPDCENASCGASCKEYLAGLGKPSSNTKGE